MEKGSLGFFFSRCLTVRRDWAITGEGDELGKVDLLVTQYPL